MAWEREGVGLSLAHSWGYPPYPPPPHPVLRLGLGYKGSHHLFPHTNSFCSIIISCPYHMALRMNISASVSDANPVVEKRKVWLYLVTIPHSCNACGIITRNADR